MTREHAISEKNVYDAFCLGEPIQEACIYKLEYQDTEDPDFSNTSIHRVKPIEDRNVGYRLIKSFKNNCGYFFGIYSNDDNELFPFFQNYVPKNRKDFSGGFRVLIFPTVNTNSYEGYQKKLENGKVFDFSDWKSIIYNSAYLNFYNYEDLCEEASEWLVYFSNKIWIKKINHNKEYKFTHYYNLYLKENL